MRIGSGRRAFKMVAILIVAFTGFSLVTMLLWNRLVPMIFGLKAITFWQAVGLVILSKMLFGGFRSPFGDRRRFRQHMEERFAKMSPEEREKFRSGMRGRCGWGRGAREKVAEQGTGRV